MEYRKLKSLIYLNKLKLSFGNCYFMSDVVHKSFSKLLARILKRFHNNRMEEMKR